MAERYQPPENPVDVIKGRKWLPGNVVAHTVHETSWGSSTGQHIVNYRLEDGSEFGTEVTDNEGEVISRMMYVRGEGKTRKLLWEKEKDVVSEYTTTKDENGATSSGWVKIG